MCKIEDVNDIKKEDVKDEERDRFLRQFEAGRYLKHLRGDRPLTEVSKLLGVSTNYISEIERGKLPSDHFLLVSSKVYKIDEDDLFSRWGKIPILAKKEVTDNPTLLSTLAEIGRNKKLSDEPKREIV